MRDDRERLADILEAIDRAQRYAVRGRAAFETDELIQAWTVQQLMVIGEAASRLSVRFTSALPRSRGGGSLGCETGLLDERS